MTEDRDPAPDPELEGLLEDARGGEVPGSDLDAMFASVERRIGAAEKQPSFWLKSRSTPVRAAIGFGVGLVVLGLTAALLHSAAEGAYSPWRLGIALGALGALLALAVHQALRPLHRPRLPIWARGATVALTLAATFALAMMPTAPDDASAHALGQMVSPCTFLGLLAGLPVYVTLRLLERDRGSAALVGACAAGLVGDLALEIHCPRAGGMHLMFSHFAVAFAFVAGLGLAHLAIERLRQR